MTVRVVLRKDAGRLGFPPDPWIRDRSIAKELGPPDPASLACVVDHKDQVLGWGCYSPDSKIRVRLLQLGERPPPRDWLPQRIAAARSARAALRFEPATTGYREINSEGDGLPGLVCDRYETLTVVQLTTAAMVARRDAVVGALLGDAARGGPKALLVIAPEGAARREGFAPFVSFEGAPTQTAPETLSYLEHGLRFEVPAPPAQKTGAYHDQRDNRSRLARLAAGGGPLLDLGCHVGGFAIHAAHRGVQAVGVDRSSTALEHARRNAEQNGVGDRIRWIEADMFGALDHPDLGGPFGTVVFDPPKVASSRRDLPRAVAAMQRTAQTLLSRLLPGGRLVICSCSQHLDDAALDRVAAGAAASLGRSIARLARWGAGEDHPVAPGHAQGEYLRVHVLQAR